VAAAIGLLVIGDELLSGKRVDKHLPKVIELLAARGLSLAWARFIGDDLAAIADAMRAGLTAGDIVLSCGGIGATPDDCTRQAAALACDRPLRRHPEAAALIEHEYGARALPNRVLMADFPDGATLIPNPVNRVAGFSVDGLHCVPGFPDMAWPMLAWVLDTRYPNLHHRDATVEYRLRVMGTAGEGDLLTLMEATLAAHPGLKLSSLPHRGDADRPRHIEFGFKGAPALADAAFRHFHAGLQDHPAAEVIEILEAPEGFAPHA
jgi:molybdopterin-biosynthesis enzyme MoeA-like protein